MNVSIIKHYDCHEIVNDTNRLSTLFPWIVINLIEFATLSGSAQSTAEGLPVLTPQKEHERVQILPNIIKVAVPSAQHSPIFGQLPEVQIVFNLYFYVGRASTSDKS